MRSFLIIFFIIISIGALAQPQLPDIAGAVEKGVVVLTWDCQYAGLKSISVLRSSDSVHNFTTIGYVKKLGKGVQAFIDGHPIAGKSWYQLFIVFSSDLTWNSNTLRLRIDSSVIINQKMVLPPNDSLQRFVVMETTTDTKSKSGIVVHVDTASGLYGVDGASATTVRGNMPVDTMRRQHGISVTLDDPGSINPYAYVKSHYVFTNPLTGHVNMEVPDVKGHKYSVKFFDDKEKPVLDVPRISESQVILDKRNFRKKGLYKFILRQDNSELETGYITIY